MAEGAKIRTRAPHCCDRPVSNRRPWASRAPLQSRASLHVTTIVHPGATRQAMVLCLPYAVGVGPARPSFSCRLLSGGRWSTRSPRLSAPSVFKAVPARLSGSSSIFWSGRGESNTGNPAPKAGDLPLAYTPSNWLRDDELNVVSLGYEPNGHTGAPYPRNLAPQVRIERTTTRLTAACSTS
jgi:hypothetical protein